MPVPAVLRTSGGIRLSRSTALGMPGCIHLSTGFVPIVKTPETQMSSQHSWLPAVCQMQSDSHPAASAHRPLPDAPAACLTWSAPFP